MGLTSPTGGAPTAASVGAEPADPDLTTLATPPTAGLVESTGSAYTSRALGVAASTSVPTRADADTRYALAGSASSARLLPAQPISSTVLGSYYRRDPVRPHIIETCPVRRVSHLATVADAKASPPGGRTISNSTRIIASDIGITASGEWYINAGASDIYDGASATQPVFYTTVEANPFEPWEVVAFFKSATLLGGDERFGLYVMNASNAERAAILAGYASAAPNGFSRFNAASGANFALTAGNLTGGLWMRLRGLGTSVYTEVNVTDGIGDNPPVENWVTKQIGFLNSNPTETTWRVGPGFNRATGSSSIDGSILFYDDSSFARGSVFRKTTSQPTSLGWPTSPEITVCTRANSSTSWTTTQLRAILAGACNVRPCDGTAWECRARKVTTAGAFSGGTWRAIAAAEWDGTGDDHELTLRPASGNAVIGSIDWAAFSRVAD